jgi:hypothetical protein
MEGLHTFGDILTKISVNCVLNYTLHYYLCIYFYGFSRVCCMCIFIIVLYESVHLQNVFFYFKLYIYNSTRFYVCICFNLYTVQKTILGIDQLDVGDVTIWYHSYSFNH